MTKRLVWKVFLATLLFAWILWIRACMTGFVSEILVATQKSPDNKWTAKVVETTVDAFSGMGTTCGVEISLKAQPQSAFHPVDVDTRGYRNSCPVIAWTSARTLQITVANFSEPHIAALDFEGVHFDIKYDPDDPRARAAWKAKWDRELDEIHREATAPGVRN